MLLATERVARSEVVDDPLHVSVCLSSPPLVARTVENIPSYRRSSRFSLAQNKTTLHLIGPLFESKQKQVPGVSLLSVLFSVQISMAE